MLKDVLTYNLEVVFCGTAKGKASAKLGYYYAGRGNKFYNILHRANFTPYQLEPNECYTIDQFNIGLTDLVHLEYGNDNEISDKSYDIGSFLKKMERFKPNVVAFNSKKAASFVLGFKGYTKLVKYGIQTQMIGSSKVYVLPSTSGSSRKYWDNAYWIKLREYIDNK